MPMRFWSAWRRSPPTPSFMRSSIRRVAGGYSARARGRRYAFGRARSRCIKQRAHSPTRSVQEKCRINGHAFIVRLHPAVWRPCEGAPLAKSFAALRQRAQRLLRPTSIPAAIAAIVVVLFGMFADRQDKLLFDQKQRAKVAEQLDLIRTRLEGDIESNIQLV